MNIWRRALGIGIGLFITHPAVGKMTPEQAQGLPSPAGRPIVFATDIKPILESRCLQCHGHGRDKGGFQLDTRAMLLKGADSGPVVVAGKSQESLLIELVAGIDPDNVMPRKGTRLTPEQVGLLRAWIDQGLTWDSDVTFARPPALNLKPRLPQTPVKADTGVNPVDQLLKPYFASHAIKKGPLVSDAVFARRVYLDTIGLLPPSDLLGAFVTDDDPALRARLVRTLLANNKAFAEHWLSFWNDLLRNDYRGTGYIDGGRKQITKWLYQALANDLPYDRFVAALIDPGPETEGFTKGIIWRGVVNASQAPPMQAAQNIAQVFMGVNLKCASCHDSFINDWKLSDSYSLACVYSDGPLEMFQCDKPTGKTAQAAFIYPELGAVNPSADRPERLKELARVVTGQSNGRLPRTIVNRLWARFFGRGLVEPVDDMEQPAWNPDLLDWLAEDLVTNRYNLKHTIEIILTSQAYQLPAVDLGETTAKDYVFHGPALRRMTAEQFRDALAQLTGVWFTKSEFPTATKEVRDCFASADPLTSALGRPNREQVVTSRATAATTLQGLELTNGKTLADLLHWGAWRLLDSPTSSNDLVGQVFRRGLNRAPSSAERELALQTVGRPMTQDGVEDLLWAVAMLPDFQLIY